MYLDFIPKKSDMERKFDQMLLEMDLQGDGASDITSRIKSINMHEYGWPVAAYSIDGWRATGLLVDISTALSILFAVAFISESIIRRREARKP